MFTRRFTGNRQRSISAFCFRLLCCSRRYKTCPNDASFISHTSWFPVVVSAAWRGATAITRNRYRIAIQSDTVVDKPRVEFTHTNFVACILQSMIDVLQTRRVEIVASMRNFPERQSSCMTKRFLKYSNYLLSSGALNCSVAAC